MKPLQTSTPRNPWPIAIIAYFACAIVLLSCFVAWSLRQRDDLVSADYYEREVRYQTHLDAVQRSQIWNTNSLVTIDLAAQTVVIRVPQAVAPGGTGRVHFYRPADARLDWESPLNLDAAGAQSFGLQRLRDGLWKVRVHWRVQEQDYYFDQTVVIESGSVSWSDADLKLQIPNSKLQISSNPKRPGLPLGINVIAKTDFRIDEAPPIHLPRPVRWGGPG
jgi:nitrogen fixation protein FixH